MRPWLTPRKCCIKSSAQKPFLEKCPFPGNAYFLENFRPPSCEKNFVPRSPLGLNYPCLITSITQKVGEGWDVFTIEHLLKYTLAVSCVKIQDGGSTPPLPPLPTPMIAVPFKNISKKCWEYKVTHLKRRYMCCILTRARKMTSFCFLENVLCFRVRVRVT